MSRTYSGTPEPRYVAMSESTKKIADVCFRTR